MNGKVLGIIAGCVIVVAVVAYLFLQNNGTHPAPITASTITASTNSVLLNKAFAGSPLTVRFDEGACTTFQLGTIKCGTDYTAQYDPGANRWTVTGYNLGSSAEVTVAANNTDRKPGLMSIWGAVVRFDGDGALYYSDQKVGRVTLK